MSSDPDYELDSLLSDAEPEAPNARARRAAAGVASAFGLALIWLVALAVVAAAVGYFVLFVWLGLLHSPVW